MAVEAAGEPARQQLIRSLNEQLLLDYIRGAGKISRPDLARMSRLSKPTVSLALANLERAGLVRHVRAEAPARPGGPRCSTRCGRRPAPCSASTPAASTCAARSAT